MIIIATYKPDDFVITAENNFYQFWLYGDGTRFNDKKLNLKEAEKKIEDIIEKAVDSWR